MSTQENATANTLATTKGALDTQSVEPTQHDVAASSSLEDQPKDASAAAKHYDDECDSADDSDSDDDASPSMVSSMIGRGMGTVVKGGVRLDGEGKVVKPIKK